MPAKNTQNPTTQIYLFKVLSLPRRALFKLYRTPLYTITYKAGFRPNKNVRDKSQLLLCSSSFVQG